MQRSESWRPVVGWENLYEVSDYGRVRSLDRLVPNRWGGLTPRKGCLIAPWKDRHGYLMVNLYRDGKTLKRPVHQLVLEAFAGPRTPGKESLHGRGGNQDNRWPENLRYGTHAENCTDTVDHGRHRTFRGEQARNAKLTDAIVLECRRRYAAGEYVTALALEFDVDNSSISNAVQGKSWRHLPLLEDSTDRRLHGSVHPKAKLTEEAVRAARRRARQGETIEALAREYGVSGNVMGMAIKGRTWRHVPFDVSEGG